MKQKALRRGRWRNQVQESPAIEVEYADEEEEQVIGSSPNVQAESPIFLDPFSNSSIRQDYFRS